MKDIAWAGSIAFVLGLVLGVIALRIETPILPIVAHFLFNFLNFLKR